jgi:hypothetical protein
MVDPVTWTEKNRILKGKSFSFENRSYLHQIYRDEYRDIIVYKGRQVEMSEFSMNWLLNKLDKHAYTTGLHAFPRDGQCLKFSKQRLENAIKDSEYLSDWYSGNESEIKMRKFVKKPEDGSKLMPYNFYVFGATWESKKDTVGDASRGTSLDFIVYDERQDHPNDVETVLGEGASHSEFKQSLTLGTPKLPGTQFDMQWESSDKHHWHVICKHCKAQQVITMDNIMDSGEENYYYGCIKCREELDRSHGLWLPQSPQKRPQYRGYHINQLMVCWMSANDIMKKYQSKTYPKRRFFNEVLGLAYGGDDVPITLPMMMACANNKEKIGTIDGAIYVGVDWGSSSYAVLQSKTATGHRLVDCIVVGDSDPREHPRKIARFLKKYAPYVKRVVCDAGPDITRFYNLRDELVSNGVTKDVWACYYANPPAKTAINWNEKERNVTVGRSEYIEMIIDEISDELFIIPGEDKSLDKIDMLIDHHTNIAAVRNKTSSGMEFIIYENTGPDHFLHAKLYSDVASSNAVTSVASSSVPGFKTRRQADSGNKNVVRVNAPFPRVLRKERR